MLKYFLRPDPLKGSAQGLYRLCVDHARRLEFYQDAKVADTLEGRFELYSLHVLLVIDRLRQAFSGVGQADQRQVALALSQKLFDCHLQGLDDSLRDIGIGDLSVAKKMRKLGEALFGRAKSLDDAFKALPDRDRLEAFLRRTLYADNPVSGAAPDPAPGAAPGAAKDQTLSAMAGWVIRARTELARQKDESLMAGDLYFPGWIL